MNQTISTDDLFRMIGDLYIQLQVTQRQNIWLEQQLAKLEEKKKKKKDENPPK